jgi:hypothetical protein
MGGVSGFEIVENLDVFTELEAKFGNIRAGLASNDGTGAESRRGAICRRKKI